MTEAPLTPMTDGKKVRLVCTASRCQTERCSDHRRSEELPSCLANTAGGYIARAHHLPKTVVKLCSGGLACDGARTV